MARDAAYPEDSIMCCVLPHKCDVYHRTPAAVVLSDTIWYLNVAFVTYCLARTVWAALRTVHRYIENNIMCQYARFENHADAATRNAKPSPPAEDENTKPYTNSNTTHVVGRKAVARTSMKYDRRDDAAAADTNAGVPPAKTMMAATNLEHGRKDNDARRRKTPMQMSEQDTETSQLTDCRQPDSCRSSIEELIDENCCSDEKVCCVVKLDMVNQATTANEKQCYINNHDIQICPKIKDRLYFPVPAKEFFEQIKYKVRDIFNRY